MNKNISMNIYKRSIGKIEIYLCDLRSDFPILTKMNKSIEEIYIFIS